MIKKIKYLLLVAGIFVPSLVLGAEAKTTALVLTEGLSLYRSAHQIIVQAEKAMEAPFQSSFDPQLCLEKARDIRAYLKNNKGIVSEKFLGLLNEEITLLDMAMEYFKTVGMARPSLNTLAMPQKQYQAMQIKENFKTARAILEKQFENFLKINPTAAQSPA